MKKFFRLHVRILKKTHAQTVKAGEAPVPCGKAVGEDGCGPSPAALSCLCPGQKQLLLTMMMLLSLASVWERSPGHRWERE